MGRIGATLSGFERQLLHRLAQTNAASALASVRLATGDKINAPRDNPAGFVMLSRFQAQRSAALQTVDAISVSQSLGAGVQLTLDQIRAQLVTIREAALEDEGQTLTAAERAAQQATIDAAVAEIERLVGSSPGGRRMLDGSADYAYAGENPNQVLSVRARSLGGARSLTLSGVVTTAATQAQLAHNSGGSTLASSATLAIRGTRGTATLSVTAGEALADVAERVNQLAHRTGVTAEVTGNSLALTTIEYGAAATVQVDVLSGAFVVTGGVNGQAAGTDAVATLGGREFVAAGNQFRVQLNGASLELEVVGGFTGTLDPITVSGAPPEFVVSADLARRVTLALPSLATARLGGASGTLDELLSGAAWGDLGEHASRAVRIVDEALGELAQVEGQVDGFVQQTLQSSHSLWSGLAAETEVAIDSINAIDEEEELMLLAKNQVLAANIVSALSILSDQRIGIVELLRKAAGLL